MRQRPEGHGNRIIWRSGEVASATPLPPDNDCSEAWNSEVVLVFYVFGSSVPRSAIPETAPALIYCLTPALPITAAIRSCEVVFTRPGASHYPDMP